MESVVITPREERGREREREMERGRERERERGKLSVYNTPNII